MSPGMRLGTDVLGGPQSRFLILLPNRRQKRRPVTSACNTDATDRAVGTASDVPEPEWGLVGVAGRRLPPTPCTAPSSTEYFRGTSPGAPKTSESMSLSISGPAPMSETRRVRLLDVTASSMSSFCATRLPIAWMGESSPRPSPSAKTDLTGDPVRSDNPARNDHRDRMEGVRRSRGKNPQRDAPAPASSWSSPKEATGVFTGDLTREQEARELGVSFYLRKPVPFPQVVEIVAHYAARQ